MKVFDHVRLAIARLAPRGWRDLFMLHGLRLDAGDLAAELTRALVDANGQPTIDRTQPGFEDFCAKGQAGIEPGNPALSLLYHGLASPDVYPGPVAGRTDDDFPTLAELDAIENYIFALANRKLADFKNGGVVAVFAYQYRAGTRSVHRLHADMAYSRTGIARVGTLPFHYDSLRRSFWIAPSNGAAGVSVLPGRYAAFIAERRPLSPTDVVMHPLGKKISGDSKRTFLVPVHKLFAGDECLVGENVEMSFFEYHRTEKVRRIHQLAPAEGGVPALPGFNINQAPFVRESKDLVTLQPVGASVLLVPNPRPTLADTATQLNTNSGKVETVRFRVPRQNLTLLNRGNRFETSSFQIPATAAGRAAPEYAHIRLHVRPNGQLFDVNTLNTADFLKVLKDAALQGISGIEEGPLEAAHVLENTCDGAVAVQVNLGTPLKMYPAVSLVAAPDFLPLVDQMEVQRWAEQGGLTGNIYFSDGAPTPLCYGRDITPNPALLDPITHTGPAFDRADPANKTFAAVLSQAPQSPAAEQPLKVSVSTTWLPDAAADVFAPGWDTSMFSDQQGDFYTNYGLGSPFPEDSKLCAALNSFWPATAPDVGRTFGKMTALPLLDEELGFHPLHSTVLAGGAASAAGWDGQFGPFFMDGGQRVNFASIVRSDYTINALRGKLGIGLLGRIDAVEQLARMDAFRECADRIRGKTPMTKFFVLLVSAEKVADWSQRNDRFAPTLTGPGYLYVFADLKDDEEDPHDPMRRVADVKTTFVCQVASSMVAVRKDKGAPQVTPRLHP